MAETTTPSKTSSTTSTASSASLPPLRTPVPLPSSPRGGGGGVRLKSLGGTTQHLTTNAEQERKCRLLGRVPLLKQLLTEYATLTSATEDQLVQALRLASYADGEYIYCQGQVERDLYFIEDGKVLITQRRAAANANGASSLASTVGMALSVAAAGSGSGGTGTPPRRRSVLDAQLEVQIHTYHELEYFGELALVQHKPMRTDNAVASGAVVCAVLSERDFDTLLKPVHALLLYRHLLRAHCVLEKDRMFKELSPTQRQYLIDRCRLEAYKDGEFICRQGEVQDDRFFILAEGEADVLLEEDRIAEFDTAVDTSGLTNDSFNSSSRDLVHRSMTTVVAHKSLFQSFGEMGLLDKPRTASVVARGDVLCIVINRKQYIAATQLSGPTNALDADAEALLATTLMEEWKLVVNARNLHLSNPHVAHYLVTFIRQFKAAYNQKFAGKTLYLDFFRRLHQDPQLPDEFAFVASRIAWDSPSSSLGIIRSETRRVLSKPSAQRSPDETSFIGRLIEHTAFLSKFDVPGPHVDRYKLARCLARVVSFAHIAKDTYLFRQGKIESRAFLILRGKINIVNEDVTTSTSTIKHHEVIATLSAGDSFGELSLVTRLQRSATTMAACDTDLLVFDRDHLQHVETALPGVTVQQVMVKRAEFLSRLSFFKGSDFGQCIRVAHDLQEAVHEARHLFLQDAAQQRSLYIVKSGEIAVFMKVQVPSCHAVPDSVSAAAAGGGRCSSARPRTKTVLVRVATIGAQEFFGVAIATVNTTLSTTVTATTPVPGTAPTSHPAAATPMGYSSSSSSPTKQWDFGAAVYMSTTRVVILELTERGWRRLSPQCLFSVRNSLLERHEYNERVAQKHKSNSAQPKESGDATTPTTTAFYHVDKPWQQLHQPHVSMAAGDATCPVAASATRPPSQLARHVKDKRTKASPYATLFPPHDRGSGLASAAKATETRAATGVCTNPTMPTATPTTTTANAVALVAWGWNSPFHSGASLPTSPTSPPSPRQTSRPSTVSSLSPLVSFASSKSPPAASLSLSLLPTPPRGDRHALLKLSNLSPRSAAAHHHHHDHQQAVKAVVDHQHQQHGVDKSGGVCTAMWKTRVPAARRSDTHAP